MVAVGEGRKGGELGRRVGRVDGGGGAGQDEVSNENVVVGSRGESGVGSGGRRL